MVGMVGIGGGMAEEEPELLPTAAARLGGAPQILVRALEELGGVEIFLPGLRHGEVVAVLGLERLLLLGVRSEEHTSELQSLMRSSYAVFCLKTKTKKLSRTHNTYYH